MPRTQRQRSTGRDYPQNWPDIARELKERHHWKCERCGHPHDPPNGYTLTVHHLDMDPANCEDYNLAALCQRCHLRIQVKVDFHQGYMLEHTDWMKPHVEGFLAAYAFRAWATGLWERLSAAHDDGEARRLYVKHAADNIRSMRDDGVCP